MHMYGWNLDFLDYVLLKFLTIMNDFVLCDRDFEMMSAKLNSILHHLDVIGDGIRKDTCIYESWASDANSRGLTGRARVLSYNKFMSAMGRFHLIVPSSQIPSV